MLVCCCNRCNGRHPDGKGEWLLGFAVGLVLSVSLLLSLCSQTHTLTQGLQDGLRSGQNGDIPKYSVFCVALLLPVLLAAEIPARIRGALLVCLRTRFFVSFVSLLFSIHHSTACLLLCALCCMSGPAAVHQCGPRAHAQESVLLLLLLLLACVNSDL